MSVKAKERCILIFERDRLTEALGDTPQKYFRTRPNRHTREAQTKSMNSIQANRSSNQTKITNRRKLRSVIVSDLKPGLTERRSPEQQMEKRSQRKILPFHIIRPHDTLNLKQKIIRGCIQQLQGVLTTIHDERTLHDEKECFKGNKSTRRLTNNKKLNTNKLDQTVEKQENPINKNRNNFEQYVRNICKLKKQRGKIIVAKKSKPIYKDLKQMVKTIDIGNHSITKNEQVPSDVHKKIRICMKVPTNNKKSEKRVCKTIQEADCSSIERLQDSSFISEKGRKSLMRQLSQQLESKPISVLPFKALHKSKAPQNRQLRGCFPSDFFI